MDRLFCNIFVRSLLATSHRSSVIVCWIWTVFFSKYRWKLIIFRVFWLNFLTKNFGWTIFGMYRFQKFLSKMFLFYSSVHFRRSLWWVIEMSHQSSPLELQIRNPDRQFSGWRLMTSHIHGLIHKVWLIFKLNTAWDNGKLDLITVGYLPAMGLCQM